MLQKLKLKIDTWKERSKVFTFCWNILPFLLAIVAGLKITAVIYLINNELYLKFIQEPLGISYFVSVIVIIPIIEESVKMGFYYCYRIKKREQKDIMRKRIYTIIAAYTFQVYEAFFYMKLGERTWYLRLFSPTHFLFAFVGSYFFIAGLALHMLWNATAVLVSDIFQVIIFILFYVIFLVYLYLKYADFKVFFPQPNT